MVSESEMESVRREAKEILDKFANSLKNVKFSESKMKIGEKGFRKEGEGEDGEKGFREAMFSNAPKKQGDFILAEEASWEG